jgi:hypothetical protein
VPAKEALGAGTQLIATLENTFRKYVALDSGLPLVLALWTLATHVFSCFEAFPYLGITSPTKRCGKTRLAEVIELLSFNGLRTAGASAAAIFRIIEMYARKNNTVTLMMDEAEVLATKSERSEDLRQILNAGYRQGQFVLRCGRKSDENFEPKQFTVYCPKVLVLIGNLPDTLADRCIPIAMRRRKPGEQVDRFFNTHAQNEARPALREMAKWAKANRTRIKSKLRGDVEFLEDREAELWLPLFAVCQVAASERLAELKSVAVRISGRKLAEEPADFRILLLKDVREVFTRTSETQLTSSRLLTELSAIEESPWAGWSDGRGMDARGLARHLRPFGIEPHNLRTDGQVLKGYDRADFEGPWENYLPADLSATPLQTNTGAGSSDFSSRYTRGNVADEKCEIANENGPCSGVAVPEGEEAQNQGGFTGELIPSMPPGMALVSWELKPAPVTIGAGETVTDPSKFARGCLVQLGNALATPRRRAAWTVPQLIERLALVGVMVTTNNE